MHAPTLPVIGLGARGYILGYRMFKAWGRGDALEDPPPLPGNLPPPSTEAEGTDWGGGVRSPGDPAWGDSSTLSPQH